MLAITTRAATKDQWIQTEAWRAAWKTPHMKGNRRGATTQDITWPEGLVAELNDMVVGENYELLLDRKKFFDLIIREIVFRLEEDMGMCPNVTRLGRKLHDGHRRFLVLGKSAGPFFGGDNGVYQGEVMSIGRADLLMYVWVKRQCEANPGAIINAYFDDSSVVVTTLEEAERSNKERDKFDKLGGGGIA